jgi:glycosyltransferase involved in cell wall biosynthesis
MKSNISDISIDVVIPTLNSRAWIVQALDSVRNQNLKPKKIIVVDDGSTDGTIEYLRFASDIILLKNTGKGVAAARNCGLEQTSAEFVAFIDSDDVWHPEHLQNLCLLLRKEPLVAFAGSYYQSFKDGEKAEFNISNENYFFVQPWKIFPSPRIICNTSVFVFRRKALMDVRWLISHEGMEDYSIVMRLSGVSGFIRSCQRSVAYRKHANSFFSTWRKDALTYVMLWEKVTCDLAQGLPGYFPERILLNNRTEVVSKIYTVLSELKNSTDSREFAVAVSCLDEALRLTPDYVQYLLIRELLDFITSEYFHGGNSLIKQAQLMRLCDYWPKISRSTWKNFAKAIIEEHRGKNFYVSFFCRAPWQISRLMPIFYAMNRKLYSDSRKREYAESKCYYSHV